MGRPWPPDSATGQRTQGGWGWSLAGSQFGPTSGGLAF